MVVAVGSVVGGVGSDVDGVVVPRARFMLVLRIGLKTALGKHARDSAHHNKQEQK